MSDRVREWLRERGAPYSIVANGLQGLVDNWERIVALIEQGYPHSLDDYLNDMDSRQLLENAVEIAPDDAAAFRSRVAEADRRARQHLMPAGRCLWGQIVADEEGWVEARQWWYFARPRTPGARLRDELES